MATFSVQGMELDADGEQSESGGLGLLREELSEQDQEPPYDQGVPSGTAQVAVQEQKNEEQSGVQERARAWGQSVSRSFMREGHVGSTEGEAELVPDYASMPSQPQTPQRVTPGEPQVVETTRVAENSGALEGMISQLLTAQLQMMSRLEYLEQQRQAQESQALQRAQIEMQQQAQQEAFQRAQIERQQQAQQEAFQRAQLEMQQQAQQEVLPKVQPQPGDGPALLPTITSESGQGAADAAQSGEGSVLPEDLLSSWVNFKVGDQVPPLEQSHEERQRVVQHVPAEVPPGPQTKGQVEVQGVMYQWNVTSEGLQLVPISGSKPEASRARSSQDTSGNIFTSRARSPFTPVNPKASNKQLVNRTPSPKRYRGMPSSWQERRRAASRSPARGSTPGSAPNGLWLLLLDSCLRVLGRRGLLPGLRVLGLWRFLRV